MAVAIVGLGCRLPGSNEDPLSFFNSLLDGLDGMIDLPKERWDSIWLDSPKRKFGIVNNLFDFDAKFFSISPVEASRMDPLQRLLLEASVHSLQDAGLRLSEVAGSQTGVFFGCSAQDSAVIHLGATGRADINGYTNTGVSSSIASNRVSYLLDLHGPSLTVDTACSSSLLAVHLGVSAIRRGECQMALVGGANILISPGATLGFARGGFLSPDGHCKAFDASANGFARSEGVVVLALESLNVAIEKGHRVYSTILGSATNEDGHSDGGMTHPDQRAQQQVIEAALKDARVNADQIQYVEAHGTGTPVGDPIEATAIGTVIGKQRHNEAPCLIGSVKTNIGHLEPASGAVGLLKLSMSLFYGIIPANLHFKTPNPSIDFKGLNLKVVTANSTWPLSQTKYAGINSFGFGGANVHAVLTGPPRTETYVKPTHIEASASNCNVGGIQVLCLSARSKESLVGIATKYKELLLTPGVKLEDVCHATIAIRDSMEERVAFAGRSCEEITKQLSEFCANPSQESSAFKVDKKPEDRRPRIAFVCSGQGPQWPRMAKQLMEEEPVFARTIQRIDTELEKLRPGWSLIQEILRPEQDTAINNTAVAQPALMAMHIALAELWLSRGLIPAGVVGHSVGEVAAAYISGALSLEEAVRVIHHRSVVQAKATGCGSMLAVGLSESDAKVLIPSDSSISIAALNSPSSTTLSGDTTVLEGIQKQLDKSGVFAKFLKVQIPFHSPKMQFVREELLDALKGLSPRDCKQEIYFYSTVTGLQEKGPSLAGEYWFKNVRQAVLFYPAITKMIADGFNVFVELSPHPALSHNINEIARAASKESIAVAFSMRNNEDQSRVFGTSLSKLFTWGVDLHVTPTPQDFSLRLPLYAFNREHLWQENVHAINSRIGSRQHLHILDKHHLIREPESQTCDIFFDLQEQVYLKDHKIDGQIVLAGAAHTDLALSAGVLFFGEQFKFLEDVTFHRALFLPAEAKIEVNSHRGCYYIFSRPSQQQRSDEAWTLNSYGRFNILGDQLNNTKRQMAVISLAKCKELCTQVVSPTDIYSRLARNGLELGPCFRCLKNLWMGPNRQCLAHCVLPPMLANDPRHNYFTLHPSLLDACIIASFAPFKFPVDDTMGVFLPSHIAHAAVYIPGKRVVSEILAHIVLVELTDVSFTSDMHLMLPTGELVAEIHGLTLKLIQGTAERKALSNLGALYAWKWRDTVSQNPSPTLPDVSDTKSLLITNGSTDCALVSTVASALKNVTTVPFDFPSLNICDYSSVAIVFPFYASSQEQNEIIASSIKVLEIAKSILACGRKLSPRNLLLITCSTQSVLKNEAVNGIAHSALWGLARVLITEFTPLCDCVVSAIDTPCTLSEEDTSALISCIADRTSGIWIAEEAIRSGKRFTRYLSSEPLFNTVKDKLEVPSSGGCYFTTMPSNGGGVLTNLRLESFQAAQLANTQVEIAVKAASLNFRDVLCAIGMLPAEAIQGSSWGTALGCECSGVITRIGSGVSKWKVGDEVVAWPRHCLAGVIITEASAIKAKLAWMSFEMAAAVPLVYATAHYALHHQCRMQRGEWLLIHSAAGGVGIAAINLARHAGVNIIATASLGKHEFLRSLGVEHVFDSGSMSFYDEVMKLTNRRGVDIILNSLSGKAITQGLRCLAPFGRFAEIGKMDIYRDSKLSMRLLAENCSFFAVDFDKLTSQKPELTLRIVDEFFEILDEIHSHGNLILHPLNVFPISRVAEAFSTLSKGKALGKVVCSMQAESTVSVYPPEPVLELDKKGSYIITGGTSGFGLSISEWLASKGAGEVILVSRSGSVNETISEDHETLACLQRTSARVSIMKCDVSDLKQVTTLVSSMYSCGHYPLRGVIHAAAVFEDCPISDLVATSLASVLLPKAVGAWNFHLATSCVSTLQHFVLVSSISSIVGNPGQANYSAANAFLDSLCFYRRAKGLPATTINYGPIGSAGYLMRGDSGKRVLELLASKGFTALSSKQSLSVLEHALSDTNLPPQLIASLVEWSQVKQIIKTDARFDSLLVSHDLRKQGETSFRDSIIKSGDVAKAHQILQVALQKCVAKVSGASSPELIDVETGMSRMGMDSLMMNQLQSIIFSELGIDVPLLRLIRGPSISNFAKEIATDILSGISTNDGQVSNQQIGRMPSLQELSPLLSWESTPTTKNTAERAILVTGVTGKLGAFLLREIIHELQPQKIFCIIRANTKEEAEERGTQLCERMRSDEMQKYQQIVFLKGDVSEPMLGCTKQEFQTLIEQVDTVFHNAAEVNWIKSYDELFCNVKSTANALQLASRVLSFRMKHLPFQARARFYLTSSVSVQWDLFKQDKSFAPDDTLSSHPPSVCGYFDTKWASEALTLEALKKGLISQVGIFRPDVLLGSSETGECAPSEITCMVAIAIAHTGLAPICDGVFYSGSSYEYTALTMVHLAKMGVRSANITGTKFTVATLVGYLREFGYKVKFIALGEWLSAMSKQRLPISLVVGFLKQHLMVDWGSKLEESTLVKSGLSCHPLRVADRKFFHKIFSFLVAQGQMPAPTKTEPALE